jgi:endonuclease III
VEYTYLSFNLWHNRVKRDINIYLSTHFFTACENETINSKTETIKEEKNLDFSGFDVVEKEGIVDIDSWNELRELRNRIAHEYPEEIDEMVESINLFIKKSGSLVEISNRLEEKYHEIKRKRDSYH